MKTTQFLGLLSGMMALAGTAMATVNADQASNYGGVWTNGSNGGGGFGAWTNTAYSGSGWAGCGIWASSNANLSMGDSFAYVAKGDGSYITIDRSFSQALTTGDTFSLDLGLNYDTGSAAANKGFALRNSANREIVVVNQAASQIITVNGGTALTNYGTTTMHWTFTQKSSTQITVYATGRSGSEAYTGTISSTGDCRLANVHFYASGITNDAYAEYRQVYFDNLTLSQGVTDTNVFLYRIENSQATVTALLTTATGEIIVPSTLGGYPVTMIGRSAFKDRTNITSIGFASGGTVTNVDATAFQGCTSVTQAVLPSGSATIPVGAFYGCTGLVSVAIPSTVTRIGETAFADCRSLSALSLPSALTSLGESAFLNCRRVTTLDIPNAITFIPGQCCYECRALTSVDIPSGVTNIGYAAFYNCGLTSLTLPAGLAALDRDAFHGCVGLTTLTINSALYSVSNQVFYGCTNLAGVYFYGGVSNLGVGVFGYCGSLAGVYFLCSPPSLGSDAGADMFVGSDDAAVYYLVDSSTWGTTYCGVASDSWKPTLDSPVTATTAFSFEASWANGRAVRMQACTNLANPNWVNLSTGVISDGSCLFSDTNWTGLSQRYYRVTSTN